MDIRDWEMWVRRVSLTVLIVLFAAASAQAAGDCHDSAAKRGSVAPRGAAIEVGATGSGGLVMGSSVQDNDPYLSKPERSMSAYLALHCEVVSGLLLGQAVRAYDGAGCNGAQGENATQ